MTEHAAKAKIYGRGKVTTRARRVHRAKVRLQGDSSISAEIQEQHEASATIRAASSALASSRMCAGSAATLEAQAEACGSPTIYVCVEAEVDGSSDVEAHGRAAHVTAARSMGGSALDSATSVCANAIAETKGEAELSAPACVLPYSVPMRGRASVLVNPSLVCVQSPSKKPQTGSSEQVMPAIPRAHPGRPPTKVNVHGSPRTVSAPISTLRGGVGNRG